MLHRIPVRGKFFSIKRADFERNVSPKLFVERVRRTGAAMLPCSVERRKSRAVFERIELNEKAAERNMIDMLML
jgi:hypothetical protein